MDPYQEQVAQRVLGGLHAGDGDPGGKSGIKKPAPKTFRLSVSSYCIVQLCNVAVSLQVHVVRPVLNRIDTLIRTTVTDSRGNTKK